MSLPWIRLSWVAAKSFTCRVYRCQWSFYCSWCSSVYFLSNLKRFFCGSVRCLGYYRQVSCRLITSRIIVGPRITCPFCCDRYVWSRRGHRSGISRNSFWCCGVSHKELSSSTWRVSWARKNAPGIWTTCFFTNVSAKLRYDLQMICNFVKCVNKYLMRTLPLCCKLSEHCRYPEIWRLSHL